MTRAKKTSTKATTGSDKPKAPAKPEVPAKPKAPAKPEVPEDLKKTWIKKGWKFYKEGTKVKASKGRRIISAKEEAEILEILEKMVFV